ncbi:hypothetical protein [uncultured Variovorax sp.]|uniref:hypothetical protein n=1 Tax=uncultured Variovorax sp. TaxID=114708 RepID=UPI0026019229|nr:hypothetical protein [uncultured Variovorax sp.]
MIPPLDGGPCYTGIGSRSTPSLVLEQMRELAAELAGLGYLLRSGAADGADMAFEQGCDAAGGRKAIFLPWPGFQGRHPDGHSCTYLPGREAFELAATLHPAWSNLSRGPRALHARNSLQILGLDLATPSAFVLCWTADCAQTAKETSSKTGGTGTAIRLASLRDVPVFNLARDDALMRLRVLLGDALMQRQANVGDAEEGRSVAPVIPFPN